MPEPLVSRVERELFFRTFVTGVTPSDDFGSRFVDMLREDLHPPGALIFRKGELSERMFYVVRGSVELRSKGDAPFHFTGRSAIGGLDALQGVPYTRDAVAMEETVTLRIRMEDYFELLEDHFDVARQMVQGFARGADALIVGRPDEVMPERGQETPLVPGGQAMGLVERLLVLRSAELFRKVRLQVLVRLAQLSTERALAPGEAVLDQPGMLWSIASGAVRLERDEPPLVATIRAGATLATLAVLGGAESIYSATTLEPTRLLGVRRTDLIDVMEDHADLIRCTMGYLAAERARLMRIQANRKIGD